jgi:hypothetical protein
MKKKPDSLIYILGLVGLIIVAIITTAIISAVKNNQSAPADIRAHAGVIDIVKLTGTVSSTDDAAGTVTVDNVQFSAETRSGPAINYGTWTVTPPASVNLNSLISGKTVTFVVNSASFDVASHKVVASQLSVSN